MTTYAEYDFNTQSYLLGEADDTYIRPLFSILEDDPHDEDDHKHCAVCQGFDYGARWVPDNGGAWVNSSCWQVANGSIRKYSGLCSEL